MAVAVGALASAGSDMQTRKRSKAYKNRFASSPPMEDGHFIEFHSQTVAQGTRGFDSDRQGAKTPRSMLPLAGAQAKASRDGYSYSLLPTHDETDAAQDRSPKGQGQGPEQTCSTTIIDSWWFNAMSIVAIVCNSVLIGYETDNPNMPYWTMVENLFLTWFVLECGLRLFALGPRVFFCGEYIEEERARYTARRMPADGKSGQGDAWWNILDFSIVSLGVINAVTEQIEYVLGGGRTERRALNTTLLRTVRLARTLRILRVVRVLRFLKQLYLLAYGFIEGALAVFWVAVLTGIVIYMCAIILVRSYGSLPDGDAGQEFLAHNFQTVGRAMWTLFGILASPTLAVYNELIFDYPCLLGFIVVFVLFGSFGISGLLTGVISESIIDKNTARIEDARFEREHKRRFIECLCREVYDKIDIFKTGHLPKKDFYLEKSKVQYIFQTAGIPFPEKDFIHLLNLMDLDDSGTIEKDEFVHCILELCDDVRPMSIVELHSQLSQIQTRLVRLFDKVDKVQEGVNDTRLKSRLDGRKSVSIQEDQFIRLRDSCLAYLGSAKHVATKSAPAEGKQVEADAPRTDDVANDQNYTDKLRKLISEHRRIGAPDTGKQAEAEATAPTRSPRRPSRTDDAATDQEYSEKLRNLILEQRRIGAPDTGELVEAESTAPRTDDAATDQEYSDKLRNLILEQGGSLEQPPTRRLSDDDAVQPGVEEEQRCCEVVAEEQTTESLKRSRCDHQEKAAFSDNSVEAVVRRSPNIVLQEVRHHLKIIADLQQEFTRATECEGGRPDVVLECARDSAVEESPVPAIGCDSGCRTELANIGVALSELSRSNTLALASC